MTSQVSGDIPAIELRGLTKVFDTVVANAGVDLRVKKGTIHGLIGENGAGKSTAMKMLYGIYQPDAGEIRVHGKLRNWKSPLDAIRAGIGMVHQHFMLAGPYTALDNILLGAESGMSGWSWLPRALQPMDRKSAKAKLQKLASQYELPVDWDAPVEELPVGVQQRIEILKLLYREADILILDEPTAVLTPQETQALFSNLKKMRDQGKTVIIITHKLKEVMSVTEQVTVFRAGKVTGQVETIKTQPQDLADLMVGRKVVLNVQLPPQKLLKEAVLQIQGLALSEKRGAAASEQSVHHRLKDLSLTLRGGEILGIAGVEGNGQSELIQAILHPRDPACRSQGKVEVLGHDVTTWTTDRIKDLGVGVVPEDRHHEGLLLERPVEENFLLGLQRQAKFSRYGFVSGAALTESATRALEAYDVRPRSLDVAAGLLSGGNQQKLIIAREFERSPRFLIAAQPTRGVDVGAIEFIHQRIIDARTKGAGVLLISSELDEILALSDRILVMYEGRIVGEFGRGEVTEKELGLRMGGGGAT